jgi:hypothetical protein
MSRQNEKTPGTCDKPKVLGIFLLSRYMVQKYGEAEAIRRTIKRDGGEGYWFPKQGEVKKFFR